MTQGVEGCGTNLADRGLVLNKSMVLHSSSEPVSTVSFCFDELDMRLASCLAPERVKEFIVSKMREAEEKKVKDMVEAGHLSDLERGVSYGTMRPVFLLC